MATSNINNEPKASAPHCVKKEQEMKLTYTFARMSQQTDSNEVKSCAKKVKIITLQLSTKGFQQQVFPK